MVTLNPYLNFPGNAEEAFNFYKSVFGGEFTAVQRFKDTPEADKVPPADADKIMHIALPIGKGNILMATDAVESMGQKLTPGNNFYLSIAPRTVHSLRCPFACPNASAPGRTRPTAASNWFHAGKAAGVGRSNQDHWFAARSTAG